LCKGSFTLAKFVKQNRQLQRQVTVTTVLALATLGSATQIGSFLFYVMSPKVAKANTVVTVAWLKHVTVANGFANKLRKCE
jgi:hypothetical protein